MAKILFFASVYESGANLRWRSLNSKTLLKPTLAFDYAFGAVYTSLILCFWDNFTISSGRYKLPILTENLSVIFYRATIIIKCDMDFVLFPLDVQTCAVDFGSCKLIYVFLPVCFCVYQGRGDGMFFWIQTGLNC